MGGKRRDVLEMYRLTRPSDVPAAMVEAATARRLAGDVAGAFAAARVDLDVDVATIVRLHGREMADQVIDDLSHIAPDLLRWSVPRALEPPGTLIGPGLLRRYPGAGGANLIVDTAWKQPGRLRLWMQTRKGPADLPDRVPGWYHLPRAYWDVRYTGELRDLCGGGPDRIPFHDVDGRLLEVLPDGPRPGDPVAMTEWLTLLWDEGRTGAALAACGIALAEGQQDSWPKRPWVALERMVADARRLLDEGVFHPGASRRPLRPARTVWVECRDEGQGGTDLELTLGPDDQVTARLRRAEAGDSRLLTAPEYRHPIDLDLLRFGLVGPEELHPAVTRALFPTRAAPQSAPRQVGTAPRTGAWELMERAFHRDTAGVRALLDAGADPLVRDRSGQTLLHLLPHLDHELLLARLLAAGVAVNAVDVQGHTALHAAAAWRQQLGGTIARRPVEDLIGRLRNAGGVDVCGKRGAPCPAGAPGRRRRPSTEDVDRLRAAADRSRYASMAELAWALYTTGQDRRAVLADCYGAPLPDEFFALADHLPLPGYQREDLRCQVWRLALPADRGGPVPPDEAGSDDYHDRVIVNRGRQLVPVLQLGDTHTEYGGLVLCYELTELDRGRSTIVGTDPLDRDGGIEQLGPSLLAVLRDYHTTVVGRLEALHRLTPEHDDVKGLAAHREALRLVGSLLPAGAPGVARPEPAAPFLAPVPAPALARLRGRASRDDYRSMARLAWALYAAGLGPDEVLAECLGVTFPDEFFVLAEADPDEEAPGNVTSLPWGLAVPLDHGGPVLRPSSMTWRHERRILAWDPDLVPLITLHGDSRWDHGEGTWRGVPHGNRLHCYRLSELAAGRSTVFGVPWDPNDDDRDLAVEPTGPSLLTVLHEHVSAQHALDEWELRQPWNRGAGSIDREEVDDSRRIVAGIEALRRRVDDRTRR